MGSRVRTAQSEKLEVEVFQGLCVCVALTAAMQATIKMLENQRIQVLEGLLSSKNSTESATDMSRDKDCSTMSIEFILSVSDKSLSGPSICEQSANASG